MRLTYSILLIWKEMSDKSKSTGYTSWTGSSDLTKSILDLIVIYFVASIEGILKKPFLIEYQTISFWKENFFSLHCITRTQKVLQFLWISSSFCLKTLSKELDINFKCLDPDSVNTQNQKMVGVERELWRSYCSNSLVGSQDLQQCIQTYLLPCMMHVRV